MTCVRVNVSVNDTFHTFDLPADGLTIREVFAQHVARLTITTSSGETTPTPITMFGRRFAKVQTRHGPEDVTSQRTLSSLIEYANSGVVTLLLSMTP